MKPQLPAPLRLPTAWFIASLLLGSSVFYLALETHLAAETRQLAARTEAGMAARDLNQTPERLAQERAQAATYTHLRSAGFLGQEDRLDWLGSLAQLRAEQGLQQLNWRLSPRTTSNLSPGLHSSIMTLEIAPADGPRLAQFLARLRMLAHGRFTVRECTLNMESGVSTANCTLEWWTWNDQ